ncbi:MAG: hypothetical protein ACK42C_06195 [Aquificaceae bacterium]|jgi:uncharacterized membrane protein|uniref:hypothetical protein n=1 Tax=Hydrogenobacter sp. Uz 6-8 TaxID=3384828 RepID=UPI000F255A07|nr:MAG: hypothetical protein D6804_01800 [Aquificota bacterium]
MLEEELGKEKADRVAKVLEESLKVIEEKAREQKPILKAEIKEELTKELVTKEELQIVKLELERRIDVLEAKLEGRIDRLELYLKILIGLVVLGLTLLNPVFVEFVKTIFGLK